MSILKAFFQSMLAKLFKIGDILFLAKYFGRPLINRHLFSQL